MSRLNVWPWVRPFLILVLVVSIPPVVYWYGYVQSSVVAAKRQAYSTLSAVTADFRGRLAAHDQIAANAEKYATNKPAELAGYLNSVLKASPAIPVTGATAHLSIGPATGGLLLQVGQIDNPEVCAGKAPCSMRAVIPLESLMPWSVVETEFDGLLVLGRDGLLAQDRRLPAQPLGVNVPLRIGDSPADLAKLFEGQIGTAADATQAKNEKAVLKGSSPFAFDDEVSVQLAGVDYVVFVQVVNVPVTPINASAPTGTPPGATDTNGVAARDKLQIKMLVGGLISKERLRRDAIQLTPQTLIVVGALVALGLFSIPFLKLRFIGERERMHQRDVWLLAGSILCTTALIVLVTLDGHATAKLRSRFDSGLQQFATSMADHLASETSLALEQLRASAPQLLSNQAPNDRPNNNPLPCSYKSASLTATEPVGAILAQHDFHLYPDFEALVATDLCGNQVRKWMARTITTPPINHSTESFFAPALTLRPTARTADAGNFAFGATLAPTSGLLLGVYAMPFDGRNATFGAQVPPTNRTGILAVAAPMRSVSAPIVARPFQFVLLDRRGVVAFQQTKGSFRGERFIETVRGGASLERAARSADHRPQTYQYRGKPYRMIARDIPALQLTLVAYYERDVIGSLAARMFTTSAVFALGIVAAMLLGAAISSVVFGETAFDWAWPQMSRTPHYLLGIIICVLAMLALLVLRNIVNPLWLGGIILAVPLAAIVLLGTGCITKGIQHALGRIRDRSQRLVPQSLGRMSTLFTTFVVMALLAFVAWPTLIIFNDAFNLHSTAFAIETSNSWKAARLTWSEINADSLVDPGAMLENPNCRTAADLHCPAPERTYAAEPNYSALLETRRNLAVYHDCANLRVVEGPCDVANAPEVPASFTVNVATWFTAFGRDNAELGRTLSIIQDSLPDAKHAPLLQGFQPSAWSVGGLILLLLALWMLVRSIARHVLGVELTDGGLLDDSDELAQSDGKCWLLLRPTRQLLEGLKPPLVQINFDNRCFRRC